MVKVPTGRIEAFVDKPDPKAAAILIYGPDQGLVREYAGRLVRHALGADDDPFRLVTLTTEELAAEPGRLGDEAASLTLTGGRRVIRIRAAGDAVAAALDMALARWSGDALAIIEGGELPPRSPLRKLCESSPKAAAIPCYMPDARGMADYAQRVLGAAGLSADGDALTLLAERLAGDHGLARQEIDKLITFMGGTRRVSAEDVDACVGDAVQQSLDALAMAVADRSADDTDRALGRLLAEGVAPVRLLRGVQRHFVRLHGASARVAAGAPIDSVLGSLRVFFKDQPRFRRHLDMWAPRALLAVIGRLNDAEAACKRTGAPAILIATRAVMDIAAARRPRR
ncbi:MAG: DNA polymerase III subunit delta [Rhodospirillaceae bacterium]|nr:DNA polymerase III subunit delta [Rhodospirillaceae bacterium]